MKKSGCHPSFDKFCFLVLTCLLLGACGNASPEGHESALPHHKLAAPDQLSADDLAKLSAASGKSMPILSPEQLEKLLLRDTQGVLILNFWKANCTACLEQQHWLQNTLAARPEGSCRLLAVNLDAGSGDVEQLVRTAGISAAALQLSPPAPPRLPEWDGSLPALAVFEQGQLLLFLRQPSNVQELNALLQPFLL